MSDTASIDATDVGNDADYLIDQVISLQRAIHRLKNTDTDSARSAHLILLIISKHGPLRVADLAVTMCVDASTVSRQTAWLVNDGLLTRTSDPADGRASVLALTARGESVAAAVAKRRRELFAHIIHDWPARDVQIFSSLLRRFIHGLEAQYQPGTTPFSSSPLSGETA
ncbi:MAG: MarR family transcriptional regulator [Nocardioidaceae bacterium]